MKILRPLLFPLIACLLCAGGCTGMNRTSMDVVADCVPDTDGRLVPGAPPGCRVAAGEYAASDRFSYTLYFVEFDDQGWPYDQGRHMDRVLGRIRDKLEKRSARVTHPCVSPDAQTMHFVIYVHGWKHSAAYDDDNVANFRRLVREAAAASCDERAATKREVVGIYIGWRGRPTETPKAIDFLDNLTFWDRKSVAIDVAQGGAREFFARMDALADRANRKMRDGKAVRMLIVGHSFGGHILLTALGGSVLKSLAETVDDDRMTEGACQDMRLAREGDMIVLVNAAIEGTRFEPIHSVSRLWTAPCYKAPLLVAVTSRADEATRVSFPMGRFFSTLFENYTSSQQKRADLNTLGHNERYLTHELGLRKDGAKFDVAQQPVEACEIWSDKPGALIPSIAAEFSNATDFARRIRNETWNPSHPRTFCAGSVLIPIRTQDDGRPWEWRAPVMNIRVSGSLVADHSSIYAPEFVSFIRELYMDTLETNQRARRK